MTGSNWFGYGPQSRDIRAFEVIFTSHYLVKAEKRRRRSKLKLVVKERGRENILRVFI